MIDLGNEPRINSRALSRYCLPATEETAMSALSHCSLRIFFLSGSLLLGAATFAQAPGGPGPHSYADLQSSQAYATENLAHSPRHSEWVSTPFGTVSLKAWVDHPDVRGKVPVVLVLHEVFGLTDSTRNTADRIAAMGYIAIAPDMASGLAPDGGDTPSFADSHQTSQTLTGLTNQQVNARLDAWADYARRLPQSNGKLAIVGLSWGGGAAFRYANTTRKELKLVCVFFDVGPPTVTQGPDRAAGGTGYPVGDLRIPVYGFYGAKDTRVITSLPLTQEAMSAAGKFYEPVVYPEADHAYMRLGEDPANTNPANAAAVKASLERLQRVLKQRLDRMPAA